MRLRSYGHLLFILPTLIVYALFVIWPTLSAFRLSFYDWSGRGTTMNFVGAQNFVEALQNPVAYQAAWHNLLFFLAVFVIQNTVGLGLALLLDMRPRGYQIYRTILFLPVIVSLVATGFIWSLMLSPNIGIINQILKDIGLGALAQPWLSSRALALPTIILVQSWQMLGWSIVLYLTGLQQISPELPEAARIDGAGRWQVFWNVTFPMLAPAFTTLTVLTFILIFRVFDVVYVLAGPAGSPAGTTDVLGTFIYRTAFGGTSFASNVRMSYAMAVSILMFLALGGISALMLALLRRREVQA